MLDVHVVTDFNGPQAGTKDNPYSVKTSADFDALMDRHKLIDDVFLRLGGGKFLTRGSYQWGPAHLTNWRAGKNWQIEGVSTADTEIAIDAEHFPDDHIDEPPLHVICTSEQLPFPETSTKTPEEVWRDLPRRQAVRNLTLNGGYSAMVERWRARGKMFRPSGVILQGHEAAIEGVRFRNFGASKGTDRAISAESFPAVIVGAMGAPDRDKIAQLEPSLYRFDDNVEVPSHISGCVFDDYDPSLTDDQVTVFMIMGSTGEPGGWNTGNWKEIMRADWYQSDNKTFASGSNMVQGHTGYTCAKGSVLRNLTQGAAVGVYGDYYGSRGIFADENQFLDCYHGFQFKLSPGGPYPERFYLEDVTIGEKNIIQSRGMNVSIDTLAKDYAEKWGPVPATRYIRNIRVPVKYSLENFGGEVIRTGAPPVVPPKPSKGKGGGCLLFFVPRIW